MIFNDSAKTAKNIGTKKALLCCIIPIILVVAVILVGVIFVKNLFHDCNENAECGENAYCGIGYKCYQMPGNAYRGKTTVQYNYGLVTAILAGGVIISFIIFMRKRKNLPKKNEALIKSSGEKTNKPYSSSKKIESCCNKKIRWPLVFIWSSLILAAALIIIESNKCTSVDACGEDAYCGSDGKCRPFNEPKEGVRNYIMVSSIVSISMIVLALTINYKNTNMIKELTCCFKKRK